jgi:DnaJ-domain-containing protein 1
MGVRGSAGQRASANGNFNAETASFRDPFGFFHGTHAHEAARETEERRAVRNAERKAFEQLGLDISANAQQIKAQFKSLAKRLHPDANGGDRGTEDKLREVIDAYNYLKKNGFC